MEDLSKSAMKVQEELISKGVDVKVVEMSESTRSAEDAAKTIGCEVAQIVKSLVFRTKTTKRPVLILAAGTNRVNEKAIAKLIGEKIERPDAEFVRDVTGFAIGGIPPLGHKQEIDTYIDEDLLQFAEVWAAAGTPRSVFSLNSSDIQNLTGGTIISVK